MGNTQPAHNVPWTSHEGSLNVRGYKGPTGDSHGTNKNIDDVMKKLFFRSNRPCITYLSLFFTGRANIQDPVAGSPWEQMMGRSKDVGQTYFLN